MLVEVEITCNRREVVDGVLPKLQSAMKQMGFTSLGIAEEVHTSERGQVLNFHVYYDLFSLSFGVRPSFLHDQIAPLNVPDLVRVECKIIADQSRIIPAAK